VRYLVAFALGAAPAVALACPACTRGTAPGAWLLVAGLIALPYAVVLGVAGAVRRAERRGGR